MTTYSAVAWYQGSILPVLHFRDYVLSYDRRNKTAHWVFEHLTKVSVARNDAVDRANSQFMEDESIHKFFRSNNADYKVEWKLLIHSADPTVPADSIIINIWDNILI